MESFLQQHADSVTGTLSGWDRLRFRGTLRMLANVKGLGSFLSYTGRLFKDFKEHALRLSQQVRAASLQAAESASRPIVHVDSPSASKEDLARKIAKRDGIKEGLIAVITAVESCSSFNVQSNRKTGHLDLISQHRKCQHLYHYQIHPTFGFMHARLQTWLPFNITLNINGREWLGRQMDAADIEYTRHDNCFPRIADMAAAQALLDRQVSFDWEMALKRPEGMRIKHRVNRNSVKMYDKAASVLRVETTLNDVRDLQSPRLKKGRQVWQRMRKGVADVPRRAEVSAASNGRYFQALAAVKTPLPLKTLTEKLSRPVKWKGKQVRGLNLLGPEDAALLEAVGGGEFLINGFRNRNVQSHLFASSTQDPAEQRRRCGQVTRKLRMLRAHGLIHKLPHTHRYMVSDKGRQVIAAIHAAREANIEKLAHAA